MLKSSNASVLHAMTSSRKKGDFFKELKEKYADNARRKQELVEKAEALKDSTDWKKTSDKLIALQKEWKQ